MRASVSSWPGEPGDTRRPAKFTTLNQQHWVTNTYTHTGSSSNTELSEYQPYTSYVITTPTLSADTDNSSDPERRPSAAQSWPELSMAARPGQRMLEAVRGNGYAPVRGSPVMKSHYISSILTERADSSIHHMPVRICVHSTAKSSQMQNYKKKTSNYLSSMQHSQGWVSAGRNLFLPDMRFKPEKTWKLLSYRYE